jgi:hypothetical protein
VCVCGGGDPCVRAGLNAQDRIHMGWNLALQVDLPFVTFLECVPVELLIERKNCKTRGGGGVMSLAQVLER